MEEMLNFIHDLKNSPEWDWNPDSLDLLDAISSLILAVEKWQDRIQEAYKSSWSAVTLEEIEKVAADIRDFGEEK